MYQWVKSLVSSEEVVRDDSFSFGPVKTFDDDEDDSTQTTGTTTARTELLHSYDGGEDRQGYEFELLVRAYLRDNHYQSRHQVCVYTRGGWRM